jgi:hypothetical protein
LQRPFWKAIVLGAGLLAFAPAVASADSYLVTSCHDPSGASNPAIGWVPATTPGGVTANNCATPDGGLSAALTEAKPNGNATANWRFDAPPGTRIVRLLGKRATIGFTPSSEPQDISYLLRTDTALLESCAPSPTSSCVADLAGPFDKQGLSGAFAEFRVLCTNAGAVCSRPVGVEATQMWVGLEDPAPPTVSNVKVVDDGDQSGTLRITYDAADVGGGLYRTIVKVDGKVAGAIPLAPAPCADVFPSDTDPHQFNVPVPCPAAITGAAATVDVKSLTPGPHGIEFDVEDAAGNEQSVFGPIEFPKLNANVGVTGSSGPGAVVTAAEALAGRLRMWFVKARHRGRSYTSEYGTRVVTRGLLLTPTGKAIQGARIDVYHIRNGKRKLLKTGLKSRAGGKLTLILPLNVDTRTVEFDYRALRPGPITSSVRLKLKVKRHGKVFHRK